MLRGEEGGSGEARGWGGLVLGHAMPCHAMLGAELWTLNTAMPSLVWLCFCLGGSSLAASMSILFPSTRPLCQHQHRAVVLRKEEQPKPFAYTLEKLDILGFRAEASAWKFTGILAVQSRSKTEQCELGDDAVNQGTNKQRRMWQGKWWVYVWQILRRGKRGCHLAFFTLRINLSALQWLLYLTKQLVRSVN